METLSEPAVTSSSPIPEPRVQVDLGIMEGFIGRIKEKPVCEDEALRKEAMSTEALSRLAFPMETPSDSVKAVEHLQSSSRLVEPSVISSASSTASRESAYLSDLDGSSKGVLLTPLRYEKRQSDAINMKVTSQKTSRNGRLSQRWAHDPSGRIFRMVTGCVPIVEGGKILFVSASRKSEWILPKGGWEKDEAIEESAIREAFEEAGILGVLGPRLNEIEYETRKAKKRRLEQEEAQKRAKIVREALSTGADPKVEVSLSCEASLAMAEVNAEANANVSKEEMTRIQGLAKHSDETSSVASDASAGYTHVRMALFPLYVSEVKSEWPECGRLRKAVDIDEAIHMCENRPELRDALIQVKERNLHLPQSNGNELGTLER
mmetsp:Transcript_65740/g.189540  ORF Transcript_65740/g.189540 Transcript_65740/m.189540 type:complete len:378 (+) Transcript_65740:516-1649(+)